MEELYGKLQEAGKNNVDTLVPWMKTAHVVEDNQSGEQKALALFSGAADKNNISFPNFMEAIDKLATEQNKNIADLSKSLMEKGPDMLKNALASAAGALAGAFGMK